MRMFRSARAKSPYGHRSDHRNRPAKDTGGLNFGPWMALGKEIGRNRNAREQHPPRLVPKGSIYDPIGQELVSQRSQLGKTLLNILEFHGFPLSALPPVVAEGESADLDLLEGESSGLGSGSPRASPDQERDSDSDGAMGGVDSADLGGELPWPSLESDEFMPYVKRVIHENGLQMGPVPTDDNACKKAAELVKEGKPFHLEKYQRTPALMMAPGAEVTRAVIRFDTGTGKTCVMSKVLSAYRDDDRPKIIIVPSEKQEENFYKQMYSDCPGVFHDWLHEQVSQYDSDKVRKLLHSKRVFTLNYVRARNRLTGSRGKFLSGVEPEPGRRYYDGTIVIMDEVHNLINPENTSKSVGWANKVHELRPGLMNAEDNVLIGLTATPITKNYLDIVDLLNVFRGETVVTRKDFQERYMEERKFDGPDNVHERRLMLTRSKDKLAELEAMFRGTFFVYENKRDHDKFPRITAPQPVRVPMGKEQLRRLKQTTSKPGNLRGFWNIPPYLAQPRNLRPILKDDRKLESAAPKATRLLQMLQEFQRQRKKVIVFTTQHKTGSDFIADVLQSHGWNMVRPPSRLRGSHRGRSRRGGAEDDGEEQEATTDAKAEVPQGKPAFALLGNYTGIKSQHFEMNRVQSNAVLNTYNDKANTYGDQVPVVVLTKDYAEGINFKDVRAVVLFEAPSSKEANKRAPRGEVIAGDMGRYRQVIGRARRLCSHSRLPKQDWNIDVFLLESTYEGEGEGQGGNEKERAAKEASGLEARLATLGQGIQSLEQARRNIRNPKDPQRKKFTQRLQAARKEKRAMEHQLKEARGVAEGKPAKRGRGKKKGIPEGFMSDRQAFLDGMMRDATSRSIESFLRQVAVDCPANRERTGATVCLFEALKDPNWVPPEVDDDDPFGVGRADAPQDGESMYAQASGGLDDGGKGVIPEQYNGGTSSPGELVFNPKDWNIDSMFGKDVPSDSAAPGVSQDKLQRVEAKKARRKRRKEKEAQKEQKRLAKEEKKKRKERRRERVRNQKERRRNGENKSRRGGTARMWAEVG